MATYTSGSWFAIISPSAVALLHPDVASERLPALTAALANGGLKGFIDALADATSTTATTMPAFAVAVREVSGMRVAARGAVSVTGPGKPKLSGSGVTGWAEAVWSATTEPVLSADAEVASSASLWVQSGVVLAGAVSLSEELDASSAPVGPAVTVDPDPDPEPEPETDDSGPLPDSSLETLVPPDTYATGDRGTDVEDPATGDDEPEEELPLDTSFEGLWGATIATPPKSTPPKSTPPASGTDAAMVSGVPDFTTGSAPPASAAPPAATAPATHSIEHAPQDPAPGDHDGETVSTAALAAMQTGAPQPGDAGVPTFASAEDIEKGRNGRLTVSTGPSVTLDRNVVIGRRPKATRITGEMPHLIAVPSPNQDISRNHVEVRVEGTAVVIVDLDTTNGSVLTRAGAEPMRLHPGEPSIVISGDIVDLGDGVTINFEDIP